MKQIKTIRESSLEDFDNKIIEMLSQNWKIKKGTFFVTESHNYIIMYKTTKSD